MAPTSPKHISYQKPITGSGNPALALTVSVTHVTNFQANLKEVNELLQIHQKIAGSKPGKKTEVGTLNKSAIVLLTACWESYVEELVCAAFDFLLSNALASSTIPMNVRTKASKQLREHKDETKVWDLADDGWKRILTDHKNEIINKRVDNFHSPRPENIDELYEKLIGIKSVTGHWKWKKMDNQKAKDRLNEFIDLRGEIAHNVRTKEEVWKVDVVKYVNFLNSIAVILHNRVADHLSKVTSKQCWDKCSYGNVK